MMALLRGIPSWSSAFLSDLILGWGNINVAAWPTIGKTPPLTVRYTQYQIYSGEMRLL